jgi:hypothetical protein
MANHMLTAVEGKQLTRDDGNDRGNDHLAHVDTGCRRYPIRIAENRA